MRKYFEKAKNYWISDASFVTLLLMLLFTVFLLPIMIDKEGDSTLFLNIMFIALFFVGIFSANTKPLILISSILVSFHLGLRFIRFGDNAFEFYSLERIVIILNLLLLTFINLRLLFRDEEVNKYRVAGAINVYLLVALAGAFGFEYIHLLTGQSIGGDVILTGKDEDFGDYMYFSLVSTSTVGFGELYPDGMAAKMLSVFLSVTGILYPAIVIAKLVSLGSQKK
jgi:hypothetical protein